MMLHLEQSAYDDLQSRDATIERERKIGEQRG
jgi:hypothetical protein